MSRRLLSPAAVLAGLAVLAMGLAPWRLAGAQAEPRFFAETGHNVKGLFLRYWNDHGGLAQQGYPLTEEFQELSPLDGKTYTVQYFERTIFEHHPEHAGSPYEVLLAQLGTYELRARYPAGPPPGTPNPDNPRFFPETGHTIGGAFRLYWEQHGGLAQQGYPITGEFQEQSALDGRTYTVQYFERAIFEYHPENAGTPFEVLLTQLGKYRLDSRYPNGGHPAAAPLPGPGSRPPPPPDAGLTAEEQATVDEINTRRAALGLGLLTVDPALVAAARRHAADVGPARACRHNGSDGTDPWTRMSQAGYTGDPRGEVVGCGYPTAAGVVDGWWQSAGHHDILVNPDANEIGCGWWVATPGGPAWQVCATGRR
jgi:uncharacterized protein YkwD